MTPTTDHEILSLYEFNQLIGNTISQAELQTWVVGEISEIRRNGSSGHVYLELIEKAAGGEHAVAKLRCTIWAATARAIIPDFVAATGCEPAAGLKVMVYVSAQFHELYGISGNISAIDPSFTLGDIEQQRRETLARLAADGTIDMNKNLPLPVALQRIAVISAQNAAGYGDFCNQIAQNTYGFRIETKLFPALMQGTTAEQSIIRALENVAENLDDFDVVAIIRGGGSRSDLACFDGYELASNISQFPLPVITGIGHERDNSVADMVAHTRMKTPTAVAEFIIAHNLDLEMEINELANMLDLIAKQKTLVQRQRLTTLGTSLIVGIGQKTAAHKGQLQLLKERLRQSAQTLLRNNALRCEHDFANLEAAASAFIGTKKNELQLLQKDLAANDPSAMLHKGYTLTYANGRKVRSAANVAPGDRVETLTADGRFTSVVE